MTKTKSFIKRANKEIAKDLKSRGLTTPLHLNIQQSARKRWKPTRPAGQYGDKKYDTLLWLTILFGCYGADRFYLGQKFMGLFKLFTFGGFGFVQILDVFRLTSLKVADSNGKRLLYERSIISSALVERSVVLISFAMYLPVVFLYLIIFENLMLML